MGPLGVPLTSGRGFGRSRALLSGDTGFAVAFTDDGIRVRDTTTAANDFAGPFKQKLGIVGTLTPSGDGVYIDANNFCRMALASWPYSSSAITIAGEVNMDTASDASSRVIFQTDGGGNDVLSLQFGAGSNKIALVFGTGATAVTLTATTAVTAGTWMRFVAVAGASGAFLTINGSTEATDVGALAATGALNWPGIGATASSTSGSANSGPLKGRLRNFVVLPRAVSQGVAQLGPPFFNRSLIAAMGDSHTDATAWSWSTYPALLRQRFGVTWAEENFGVSGQTTARMMARRAAMLVGTAPTIGIVYGGTNDVSGNTTVQASPAPTTTTFSVASGQGSRYGADGWIKVGGTSVQVASVATDAITLKTALGAAPAAGTAVTIDTQKNLEGLVTYLQSGGVTKILVCGQHYLNFSSGGDDVVTGRPDLVTLRGLQSAAAASTSTVYVDLYDWMRDLIVAGTYTQGNDLAWHVGLADTHLNATGQGIIADAMEAAIRAQGWV